MQPHGALLVRISPWVAALRVICSTGVFRAKLAKKFPTHYGATACANAALLSAQL